MLFDIFGTTALVIVHMISITNFTKLALSLAESVEMPHFERTSFRVRKKIFATLDNKAHLACIMLSQIDQSIYVDADPGPVYPVPNKWGLKGATYVDLKNANPKIVKAMLISAYCKVAPKALCTQYQ
jgi:hypothetical protein